MIEVLVSDDLPDDVLEMIDPSRFNVVKAFQISAKELLQTVDRYDALVVRSRTKVTREVLERAKRLKLVVRAGVGLDNVDLEAARELGVAVRNTPEAASVSVAEHAFALMLTLARKVTRADATMREGLWLKGTLSGFELRGKYLGIVGFGRIGAELAKRALAFQMEVGAYDVLKEARDCAAEMGLEVFDSLDEMLGKADFLSLHVPHLPSTHHLIGQERLRAMKPSAYLINTSRGLVVDEDALVRALENGTIAGAGLDVFREEPTKNQSLLALQNVVLTPHLGSSTRETQELAAKMVVEQLVKFFA
ncbi:MAG: hypothetical protein Kow0069_32070 [Promethearchaeota archaeon]